MIKRAWLYLLAVVLVSPAASAGKKESLANLVDSGSFGIYVNGRRVATETFKIEKRTDLSVASSEIKLEGESKGLQSAELHLSPVGDLRKYTWKEVGGERSTAIVEPTDQMLILHVYPRAGDKPLDLPFFMPASTAILDDYFFMHRQVLAWRYLSSICSPAPSGGLQCKTAEKTQYGAIAPRQHAALQVTMELAQSEKVKVKGVERELLKLSMKTDGDEWLLWIDPQDYKLMRILVPSGMTEVVRE